MNFDNLNLPKTIKASLEGLKTDINITDHTDKGANGYVFFGDHKILDRCVAIKYYYWGKDKRLHDEPRLLSEVDSPYIMEIFDAQFVDENWAMFQTPYFELGDLDTFINEGILSIHGAINVIMDVLAGVSALHYVNLVHRDLKPANIFLADNRKALIGDFGSVKSILDDQTATLSTGYTALYRPPESFEKNQYNFQGDIYQCGIVLYQLLGGYLPCDEFKLLDQQGKREMKIAKDDYERSVCIDAAIARKAKRGRLLDMSTLPNMVNNRLKRVIRKATRPELGLRYSNCATFINDLRSVKSQSIDWQWAKLSNVYGLHNNRQFYVEKVKGEYIAKQNTGKGWRRVNTKDGKQEQVFAELEKKYVT